MSKPQTPNPKLPTPRPLNLLTPIRFQVLQEAASDRLRDAFLPGGVAQFDNILSTGNEAEFQQRGGHGSISQDVKSGLLDAAIAQA